MNKKLAFEIILLSVLISILHKIANDFYLYWTTDWYDVMMHFLGGAVIGMIGYMIVDWVPAFKFSKTNFATHFSFVLGIVLIVGMGWELFELWFNMIDQILDRLDSFYDLIMDTIGGIVAFYYAKRKFK